MFHESLHARPRRVPGNAGHRRRRPAHDDGRAGAAVTDADGRVRELAAELEAGDYRLAFATGEYFAANGQQGFYPEVVVTFTVTDPAQHHHVPLLLSPYAYSTYRGS